MHGQLKYAVWGAGIAGFVGMFLPFGAADGSFFDQRFDSLQTYWVVLAFAIAIGFGVVATFRPPFKRWHAIVAAEAFAIIVLKFRFGFTAGNIGGRMMAVATVAGLVASAIAIYKPERRIATS
jgi:hypothetical protein